MKPCRIDNCNDQPVLDGLCIKCYRVTYGVTVMNALGAREQGMIVPHGDSWTRVADAVPDNNEIVITWRGMLSISVYSGAEIWERIGITHWQRLAPPMETE